MLIKKFFQRYPLLSRCVICSIGASVSDVIAQKFVEKQDHLNIRRTGTFSILGFIVVGPAVTLWYKYLDMRFRNEPNKYKAVFCKVALDQLVFTPIIQFVYITALSFLQGLNIEQTKNRLYEKFWPILVINYKLWPISQLINFFFIPLPYQIIFVQLVAIVWNSMLSSSLNQDMHVDNKAHKKKEKG